MTGTRGIRNSNPGNIRKSKDKWQGLAANQPDTDFFTFESPIYGIRALARILITYQDKHDLNTIKKIIGRWAPENENDTKSYINAVAKSTGFAASQEINLHNYEHLKPLVTAIIHHENGQQPYSSAQIDKALLLAGVEPKQKPAVRSRTIQGGTVAAGAGTIAVATGTIASVAPAVPVVQAVAETAQSNALGLLIVFGILVIGAAGYILWAKLDERRRGLT